MTEYKACQVVEELFDNWYPCVVRYAASLIGSTDRAEDIVQQSFLELYRVLRSGKAVGSPRAWTATVVRRLVYQERRRTGAFDSEFDLDALTDESLVPGNDPFAEDDARKLLEVLTVREREVVLLRLAALKYREIGAQLGIRTGAIGPMLTRALRKLTFAANRPFGRVLESTKYRRHAGETLQ